MDDEEILRRGGDEDDIEQMARMNGADLTEDDFDDDPDQANDMFDAAGEIIPINFDD